jgi:Rrf2 family transcriptional regulator, iron-sulfur cluster assembly transcription factor
LQVSVYIAGMFSKACEYALRATFFIAQNGAGSGKLSVDAVAAGIQAPKSFTAKILQQLNRGGVIASVKGPNGGFYMTAELIGKPVWDVLVALKEDQRITTCVMGLKECSDDRPCSMHNQYKQIKQQLVALFQERKISELSQAGHFKV